MAEFPFETLDVFTATRFGGNPLAVVFEAGGLTSVQMQTIAREFNLSETAFVQPPEKQGSNAKVRIFTPAIELPFAGHPTIGAAIAIASRQNRGVRQSNLVLEELAGLVPVKVALPDGDAPFAQLISPVLPKTPVGVSDKAVVARALGLETDDIGFDGHKACFVNAGNEWLFVPVASQAALARARVNAIDWEGAREGFNIVGAFVYRRGGEGADTAFRGRMFAPDGGIVEDPATGSAVATLPGQILAHDGLAEGTHKWVIEQGYEMGRPSMLYLEADVHDDVLTEIRIGGSAVTVGSGTLKV